MGSLDDAIAQLRRDVSLERLVTARGVKLSRSGTGTCPFHSGTGKRGTLTLDAKTNTWSCTRCKVTNAGVVEWTMRAEGISKRHAVELLQADHGVGVGKVVKKSSVTKLSGVFDGGPDDVHLFGQVVAFYADTLKRTPKALDFLKGHCVTGETVEKFRIGVSDRTLGYRIPKANRKGGAELRGRLQRLGIYKDTGHETLRGCVTVPIVDGAGVVTSIYGRRLDTRGVEEPDLYTSAKGLWNQQAFTSGREIVVCSSPWEALIAWSCGVRNVTSIPGLDGDLAELLEAIGSTGTTKVTLLFPRTPQGDRALSNIKDKLKGVEVFKALLPTGMDVETFTSSASEPTHLINVVRAAEWIGGVKPRTLPKVAPTATVVGGSPESAASINPASPRPDEIVIEHGDRKWRVRGLSNNTSYERLRVHLFVSRETGDPRTSGFFVDTLDLYSARQRTAFVTHAAEELSSQPESIKRDLGVVLLRLEELQNELIRAALKPKDVAPAMTDADREAALALLHDHHLVDRILGDLDAVGVVGETTNKIMAYLAAVSRKLPDPLAVLVQSSSAAGKTSLVDAVLSLVPEEDRVELSAVTGQALFYVEPGRLRHKVLAIAEEAGAARAAYALKLLQSAGSLTIASTAKEAGTGRLVTHEYKVEGPVALMMTTTATEIDEELRTVASCCR